MKFRFPAWLLLIFVAGVCAAVIGIAVLVRVKPEPLPERITRLPVDDATVISVDLRALRDSGLLTLLTGVGGAEEPEYRSFVEQTGFDYRQDLDSALVSIHRDGVFCLLGGRFDWRGLKSYAARQGGTCLNTRCRMPGSRPDRWISYFPIRQDLMGLAVSRDPWGSDRLGTKVEQRAFDIPDQPVWAVFSGSAIHNIEKLPGVFGLMAAPLGGAERIALSLGPRGTAIELAVDVTCRNNEDAAVLNGRLEAVAGALRETAAKRAKAAGPGELGAVLAGGTFSRRERRVFGRWPLQRNFIEALAAGSGS